MNIAVCDDEQVFVDYFSEIINCYFKDHGMHCSIKKFYFVQDLLKEYFESNNIDVIVLDIEMPEYDGLYAAEQIRNVNKEIPIMFLSSNNTHGDFAVTSKYSSIFINQREKRKYIAHLTH